LHVLVRAMPFILAQQPTAKVVIAGKGPELDWLRSLAWSLGVGEKVLLTGFIADDDRDRLFKIADCAVFPSLYEPFGIVALEAMAAKCPVVVSEVGGLKDVVQHAGPGQLSIRMIPVHWPGVSFTPYSIRTGRRLE